MEDLHEKIKERISDEEPEQAFQPDGVTILVLLETHMHGEPKQDAFKCDRGHKPHACPGRASISGRCLRGLGKLQSTADGGEQ